MRAPAVAVWLLLFTIALNLALPPIARGDSTTGPWPVMDLDPGSNGGLEGANLISNGRKVFFLGNDGTHHSQLWVSDGSYGGTQMLTNSSTTYNSNIGIFAMDSQGLVYSPHWESETGTELWVSDGTKAGTKMILDFSPGTRNGITGSAGLVSTGSHIYFMGTPDATHWGLCRTDGTAVGTALIRNMYDATGYYVVNLIGASNGLVYFMYLYTDQTSNYVLELWRSDGTDAGTIKLATVGRDMRTMSIDPQFVELRGKVYFNVLREPDCSIWRTDGTPAGTEMVQRLESISGLVAFHSRLNFFGLSGNVVTLYRSDGTSSGTFKITSIPSTTVGDMPSYVSATEQRILFALSRSLWVSDSTAAGTQKIKSIQTGNGPSYFTRLAGLDRWFFAGDDTWAGKLVLWQTDGTAAGTVKVPWPDPPTYLGAVPQSFAQAGNLLLYTLKDWRGCALWRMPLAFYYTAAQDWREYP